MNFKRGVSDWRVLFLLGVIFITLVFTFFDYTTLYPTGYAVTDCVDLDGDGYYDEGCTLEDVGCYDATGFVTSDSSQQSVKTDGDYLVYKDDSSGDWDIYLYDLSSGTETQISSSETTDISPEISSGYVVWQSLVSGVWQIAIYDLSTGNSWSVSNTSTHEITPDVSSDWVVWSDFRNGNWDIYGYSAGVEYALAIGEGDQIQPRLYGDYLVYTDDSAGNDDVYFYDLSTGELSQITTDTGDDVSPDIDGNSVVWQSDTSGTWDVYSYDLTTGETTVLADSDSDERFPRISEQVVVWMDGENIAYEDLNSGDAGMVTSDSYDQYVPVYASSVVYWVDYQNGNADIYGMNLQDICSAAIGDCNDEDDTIYPGITEICDDRIDNDCNGETDTDCDAATTACLYEDDVASNLWTDASWSGQINSATDGDDVSMVSYGDGNCGVQSPTFYLYSVSYDDSSGSYVTDSLIDTFTGTMENYPDDGYDVAYAAWTASASEDTYYYFITLLGSMGVIGDTVLVCPSSSSSCLGESVTVSDASDYLAFLLGETLCASDEDCSTGESCVSGTCVAADLEVDCSAQWDCSNVEWTECIDGVSTKDLNECLVVPTDDVCYADAYAPESEKTCTETENSAAEVASTSADDSIDSSTSGSETTVPFFTWFNLVLVSGILALYYFYRRK